MRRNTSSRFCPDLSDLCAFGCPTMEKQSTKTSRNRILKGCKTELDDRLVETINHEWLRKKPRPLESDPWAENDGFLTMIRLLSTFIYYTSTNHNNSYHSTSSPSKLLIKSLDIIPYEIRNNDDRWSIFPIWYFHKSRRMRIWLKCNTHGQ